MSNSDRPNLRNFDRPAVGFQLYEIIHVPVVAWAVGLCGLGCLPIADPEMFYFTPYLPAGIMVLLFYAFRDYYRRWGR